MLFPWFDADAAFAEMNALSKQMDALLGNRGLDGRHGLRTFDAQSQGVFLEGEDAWTWSVDLPGVSQKSLSITVEDGKLSVRAARTPEAPSDELTPRYLERRTYELKRTFALPDAADAEGITATLEHGVLTVRVPKRARAKPRQIEVQSA